MRVVRERDCDWDSSRLNGSVFPTQEAKTGGTSSHASVIAIAS